MYEIGAEVWVARAGRTHIYIECPECFSTRQLKVILADKTEYDIACRGCCSGYDPPSGQIYSYEYQAVAEKVTINGFEADSKGITYKVGTDSSYRCYHEDCVFETYEEAFQEADRLVKQNTAEEEARLSHKEHDTRSWSWHVHYYRKEIRDAESRIEYASKKLGIAREMQKKYEPRKKKTKTK